MMHTSAAGIELIKSHEGCELQSYPDPATGGDPWTIGYGHTGAEVVAGLIWTKERCEAQLQDDLVVRERAVARLVTAPITQGQFDALVSFAFNVGIANLASSTLLKKLNALDDEGASAEFQKWCHAAGKLMPGLLARRTDEQKMFDTA